MKRHLLMAGLAGILTVAAAGEASAWTKSGSVTTPRGTYTGTASGGCAYGTCARTKTVTGPNGNTVTRTGTVSGAYPYRAPYAYPYPYRYVYPRPVVAPYPYGASVTRSTTVVVTP